MAARWPPPAPRLTTEEVDLLRVRALQGDQLSDVREATREWVLRSLLKGRHLEAWAARAGLQDQRQLDQALTRLRRWYRQRLDAYHRRAE